MRPTAEQLEAVNRFGEGGALKINAFAGTGKTTTLRLLAESTIQRGMYLAFNKSIATEAAEKFPASVKCSTIHSLAFRATPRVFDRGDKMTGSLNANAFSEYLGYKDLLLGAIKVTARQQGHIAKQTLTRFMQGGRQQIEERHIPNFDDLGNLATLSADDRAQLHVGAMAGAIKMWRRMSDPADPLPLGHDGYLKLWALSRPQLAADFVLVDEAQDTNPVVLGVLARQRAQIVYVGDRHQQIYEWRGAVNAMDLAKAVHNTYLTTSFRFGERIADAASAVLRRLNEGRPLIGNPDSKSYIGSDACEAILSRTNASVMAVVLSELEAGRKPHVVGGTDDLTRMLRGVRDLKRAHPSDVPEFFGFSNWDELAQFSKEPPGESLRTFVKLVESHGEERLISSLAQAEVEEANADVVVSTAHKAKGREWETVQLTDDFLPSKRDENGNSPGYDEAEVRLFYVAMTRAKTAIDFSPALMTEFGIPNGPSYANPKRAYLKRVVPKPALPRAEMAPSAKRPANRSAQGTEEQKVGRSSGLTLPWWLVAAGVGALYLFSR